MGVLWKISLKKATLLVLFVCAVVLYVMWQNALVRFDVKDVKVEALQRHLNIPSSTDSANMTKNHYLAEDDSVPYELDMAKTGAEVTQKFRQHRLRHACQNHYKMMPLMLDGNASKIASILRNRFNMTYFNDYFNFTISIVFKVGSTSWRDTIINVHEYGSEEYRRTHKNPLVTLLSEFEKSPREIVKRLNDFTNIIFVRHPFSRLISAYTDKFVNLKSEISREYYDKKARLIIQTLRGTHLADAEEPAVRFDEFVKFITNDKLFPNKVNQDGHWEPYFNKYQPCKLYFDFIGHMETLSDDIEYLSKYLQIEELSNYPHNNPTKYSKRPNMKEYFSRISPELFKNVVKKYEEDLRVFGYAVPRSAQVLKKL